MPKDWTKNNLNQDAVYWPPGAEGGYGRVTPGAAVAIRCRWEDMVEEVRTAQGEQKISTAKVKVDRDLVDGGFLFLGTMADANALGTDPQDISTAFKVIKFGTIPTVNGKRKERTAWL